MQSREAGVFLAVDLGASSGRVMAGIWSGPDSKLILETVSRFPSETLKESDGLHWDMPAIFNSIKAGLAIAAQRYGPSIISIGVDSWGVDYGLLDETGSLINLPFHYRDSRTDGMQEAVQERVSKEKIYQETGVQFLFFNSIYQLYSEVRHRKEALTRASRLLFIPDLVNYWLSGKMHQERTIASTSQLLNPTSGAWSDKLISALNLPADIFSSITEPGSRIGPITKVLQEETKLNDIQVIAVAGHDTGSAFVALPGNRKDFAIMSSGTWSLIGLELDEPRLTPDARMDGFSNEIGYGKTVRFLKNISGMWLLEECRRHWSAAGRDYDYEQLVNLAQSATPMRSLIDPDSPEFATPENMMASIARYCEHSGQPVPESDADFVRCLFDSLALKYRYVSRKLGKYAESPLKGLYMLGGGVRNRLLNQITADALGVPVIAGPAEATALGNVLVQMLAQGSIKNLRDARDLVERSFPSETFEPRNTQLFEDAEDRFNRLVNRAF